jgi:RHS repeat-associated protein
MSNVNRAAIRRRIALLLVCTVGVLGLPATAVTAAAGPAAAVTGPEPIRYAYDDGARLVGVTDPAGDTATYGYDEAGNLTGITRQPSSQVSVLSLTPSRGPAGAEVAISGTGFSGTAGDNTVTFAGTAAAVTSASPTQLVVTVPAGATTGPVAVATGTGAASSTQPFTVEPAAAAPTISGFSPATGGQGTEVTISGSGFDPDPTRNTVLFNQTARGKVTAATSTSLTVEVPRVGAGKIAVRTGAGTATSAEDFGVAPGAYTQADVDSTTRVAVDGASATATVATIGKIAVVRFDGEAGQRLSLALTGQTIAGQVTVRLYQPGGVEFSGNEFNRAYSVGSSTSLSLPPLPTAGTYQVVLDPDEEAGTGSVVATLSQDVDAGVLDPAGPGTPVSIARVGQRARLAVDGTAGQRYTVAMSANTVPTGTLTLTVLWPDGEAVLSATTVRGNHTVALDPLPQTGRFQVVVDSGVTLRSFTVSLSTPADLGSLSPTGPGVAISSSTPGRSALLRFDGSAGQRLALGITGSTYSSSVTVTVVRPDGVPLTPGPLSLTATALLPELPLTGAYEMFLSPAAGSTGGATITLSLELDGGALTTTSPGTGVTVDRPGQNLRSRFDGTAGQRLSLGFTGTWFTGTSSVSVLKADGTALVPVQFLSGENSLTLPVLPETGTYEVLISPVTARTGAATVTLSAELDGGSLTSTDPGTEVTIGRPGQNARLRFDGTAGQRLGLGFTASTFGSALFSGTYRVSMLKPDGTSLMSSPLLNGAANDVDLPVLPVSGTYEAVIDPEAARTGSVTVTVSTGADAGTVDATGAGAVVSIGRPGQDARLRFDGTAGQRLSLAGTGPTFSGSYAVSVLRPDGTVLVSPRSLSGTVPDVDLPVLAVTGSYDVLVDPQSAATGSVTMTLSADVDAGVLVVGGAGVVAALGRPGQNARLRFDGTAGQPLTVALSGTTFGGFIGLSVFKPDGTTLASRTMTGTGSLALAALPVAGTYEILVDPTAGQTGSTTVALQPTPGAGAGARASPESGTEVRPAQPRVRRLPDRGEPPAGRAAPARPMPPAGPSGGPDGGWAPDPANLAGRDWRTRLPRQQDRQVSARRAPRGVTALAGHVKNLAGRPLAGVTIHLDDATARTDNAGRFLLTAPAGHHELIVDGRATGPRRVDYGTYEIGVDIAAGRTTVLPYPIWLTRIDAAHTVRFPSPTADEVVVTTPRIPGLEVHLPAGSVVKDAGGDVVRELGITAIPVDRPPFPLPRHVIVPIYFTVQPGGSYIFPNGARIVYPNYTHLAPGTRVEFWSYDPDGRGWHVYGHGSVTADGRQVVPDPGVRVYEFTGAMINVPGLAGPGSGPTPDFLAWLSGDPVDLGTGLFVDTHTDLFLPDVMPISLTRTYRQADGAIRPFGFGQNFNYGIFLQSDEQYQEADLVLPDGGKVHYERLSPGDGFSDAVFINTTTPNEWYHSTLSWNGNGWNLTRRDGMTYVFGDTTPLQAIRDRHGNQITLTRTGVNGNASAGAVTTITSPNGKWIKLTGGALVSRAEDSLGRVVEYHYDSRLRLETVTDPAGKVTRYGWNEANQVATVTDPRGITYVTNQYDGNGRVQRQTLPGNAVVEFDYTLDADRVVSTRVTDPNGHVRRVIFNANGFAVSDTSAVDTAEEQTKTLVRQPGSNLVVRTIDGLGRETAYAHDGFGNVTSVTALDGTDHPVTTTTVYGGPFNQVTEVTDPLQHATRYAYDADGNLATVTDPEGRTVTFTHTSTGEVASTTDQPGNTTTFHYEFGDLTATTDPLGRTTRLFSDAAGRVLESRGPTGTATRFVYDPRNQPIAVTDPLGHTTSFTYDDNGNLLTRTANEHTATWTYDDADRVETATDPLEKTTRYGYDPAGRLTTVTARGGRVTTFAYDALDRLVTTSYGVTGAGAESSVTNSYDAGNRLTRIVDSQAGTITLTPDDLDRVVQEATPQGTISYGYDDADRRTSMQVAGQPAVAYGYNRADQPTSITKGDQVVGFGYDAAGRPATRSLPNGVAQAYGYDDGSQLISITYQRGASTLGEITYGYDRSGRRSTVGGSYARTAVPDPFTGAGYNAADQLVTLGAATYTYDDDGNLTGDGTTAYSWNARGQLTGLSGPGLTAAFGYDALGRRTAKTVNGTTVNYLHDGDTPVQELDGTSPIANLLSGGTDAYYARTGATGTTSYLTDALGSTIGLAGTTGQPATEYTYEPFGAAETSGTADKNPFQYTGRENDGTGLSYHRARYYHPGLQRFISQDPIGYTGGGNLYAYAANSPTNLVDPDGTLAFLAALLPIAGSFLAGAFIGGAMSFGMQRLSGRKVDWGQVGFDALMGGALNVITAGMGAELALVDDIARAARPCNSFAPDTPVLMADGTSKPIADVERGDEVLAADPRTGRSGARTVTALIEGQGVKDLVDITIAGDTITATAEHPFWDARDGAWVDAEDLENGDVLLTADGERITVGNVVERTASLRAHNLTVDDLHTYYVIAGDAPVLVHNCSVPTKSNYRSLFKGQNPHLPNDWQVHHALPQKYASTMQGVKVNIHENYLLRGVDPKVHSRITTEWGRWERGLGRAPTADEITNFSYVIDQKYGSQMIFGR